MWLDRLVGAMETPRGTNGPVGGKSRSETSDLATRIAKARGQRPGEENSSTGSKMHMTNHGRAVRLGSEFIAAVLVGAVMGYGLDQWLGTEPWLMLVMLLFGFGAGVLNVTRAAADMNAKNPPPAGADLDAGIQDGDDFDDDE